MVCRVNGVRAPWPGEGLLCVKTLLGSASLLLCAQGVTRHLSLCYFWPQQEPVPGYFCSCSSQAQLRTGFTPVSLPSIGEAIEGSGLLKLRSQSQSWPFTIHPATSRQVTGGKPPPNWASTVVSVATKKYLARSQAYSCLVKVIAEESCQSEEEVSVRACELKGPPRQGRARLPRLPSIGHTGARRGQSRGGNDWRSCVPPSASFCPHPERLGSGVLGKP